MSDHLTPPPPQDAEELKRWSRTRARRRMLTGEWRQDLVMAVNRQLGRDRAEEIGTVDMSSNVFATVCTQLAVLYDVAPLVTHPDPAAAALMNKLLEHAGYAPIMQGVQRLTLGMREMLIDVECTKTEFGDVPVELSLRPVYPDLVIASPSTERSYELGAVEEAEYLVIDGKCTWVWEHVGPDGHFLMTPERVKIQNSDEELVLDTHGKVVLPYVLYHASIGPTLWDPCQWQELVDGTMHIAVKRTAASHALVMAAWPQRYTIGLRLATDDKDGRNVVVADPTVILDYDYADDKNNGTAGAFPVGFDPGVFQAALREAESQLGANSGIPATDLLRASGDARSGFALLLSRDAKKEAARRLEPAFRRSDLRLLRTIACIVNHTTGTATLPEEGWGITYRAMPMTEDERQKRQTRILELLDKGLISADIARALIADEELTIPEAIAASRPTPNQ